MIKKFVCILFFILLVPVAAQAEFTVSLSPGVIRQGDPFLVKVVHSGRGLPSGKLKKRELLFHEKSPGLAVALAFVGLEDAPGTYPVTVVQNGISKTVKLRVRALKAGKVSLTLPENKVDLSPEDEKRAEGEITNMKQKWSAVSGRMWIGRFERPLNTRISTAFGLVRIINGHRKSIHKGLDFRGAEGTPVKAINAGKVVLSDNEFFGGNTLMIDHGEGLYSIYMHLSKVFVQPGQTVKKAAVIGEVGATGRATGPHLHFSLKWRDLTINPQSLFQLSL